VVTLDKLVKNEKEKRGGGGGWASTQQDHNESVQFL